MSYGQPPQNDEKNLYIATKFTEIGGAELWQQIQAKWPGIKMNEFSLQATHEQVKCFGYDLYDSSDYSDFIHIEASPEYFDRIKQEKEEKGA